MVTRSVYQHHLVTFLAIYNLQRSLTWENGRSEGISKGRHPWSFTGSRGAQPDGQGSEHCLAILNNFYNVSLDIVHLTIAAQSTNKSRKCPNCLDSY